MRLYFLFFFILLFSCSKKNYFHSMDKDSSALYRSVSAGWEKEDFVLEEKKAMVDILIVADTSQSMSHRLSQLGRSLSDLLSVTSDYDWQIGITSADHGDHQDPSRLQQSWRDYISAPKGRFGGLMNLENGRRLLDRKILTPETPNYEGVFLHSLSHDSKRECHRPPYCHPSLEQPLRSLKAAMQRALLDNASFFRPQADFVSLIISNEEERAEDRNRATSAQQVVQTFNEIFGHLEKKYIAFNILVMDESCLQRESSHTNRVDIARSIAKLAEITGGYNISLCSQNYGQTLRELSRHIKNSLENSIVLKKEPIPASIQIEFLEGAELSWEQYGRNIIFENKGSRPISVSVSYQSRN